MQASGTPGALRAPPPCRAEQLQQPPLHVRVLRCRLSRAARTSWLWDHRVAGRALLPAAAMAEAALATVSIAFASGGAGGAAARVCCVQGLSITRPLVLPDPQSAAARSGAEQEQAGGVRVACRVSLGTGQLEVLSAAPPAGHGQQEEGGAGRWLSHVSGRAGSAPVRQEARSAGAGAAKGGAHRRLAVLLGVAELLARQAAQARQAEQQQQPAAPSRPACGCIAPPAGLAHPSGAATGFHADPAQLDSAFQLGVVPVGSGARIPVALAAYTAQPSRLTGGPAPDGACAGLPGAADAAPDASARWACAQPAAAAAGTAGAARQGGGQRASCSFHLVGRGGSGGPGACAAGLQTVVKASLVRDAPAAAPQGGAAAAAGPQAGGADGRGTACMYSMEWAVQQPQATAPAGAGARAAAAAAAAAAMGMSLCLAPGSACHVGLRHGSRAAAHGACAAALQLLQAARRMADLAPAGVAAPGGSAAAVRVGALLRTALPLVGSSSSVAQAAAGGSSAAAAGAVAAAAGLWGLLRVAAAEMPRVAMGLQEVGLGSALSARHVLRLLAGWHERAMPGHLALCPWPWSTFTLLLHLPAGARQRVPISSGAASTARRKRHHCGPPGGPLHGVHCSSAGPAAAAPAAGG